MWEEQYNDEVEAKCFMIKKNKTAAQISDIIKAYENDPALSFAVGRKTNHMDMVKIYNQLAYKINVREREAE